MEKSINKFKEMFRLMGFPEAEISLDEEHKKATIQIDNELIRSNAANLLPAIDHICNLILRKNEQPAIMFDLNYYRKERERLIIELTRASARKAMATKTDVELPAMNAYERRLVHVEIMTRPELKTESTGEGKERRIVIKHVS